MKSIYRRVLIKISGEALAAEKKTGYDFDFVMKVCNAVKDCAAMGVQVGIVIGGGNFWRGVKDGARHCDELHGRGGCFQAAGRGRARHDGGRHSGRRRAL